MLDAVTDEHRPGGPPAGTVDHLVRMIAARPDDFALYFDVDGTLIDIAETPEAVSVPADLAEGLTGLQQRLGGAVAVITGRRLADIDLLLSPARLVGSGMHGLEFNATPAERTEQPASEVPLPLVDAAVRLIASIPGLRLEQKGPILTIHYRQVPSVGARVEAALAVIVADHGEGYHLKPGRAVVELIPDGTSKGTALARIMALSPFAGRRPIMIGDDRADEDAFAVARASGGFGLAVAGEHFSAGDATFAGAAGVRSWIARLNAGLTQ
jgi:trehalose 6-phosphate phosphatase